MTTQLKSIGSSSAVDWLLDRSVLPGFTSIGYDVRGLSGSSPDPEGRLRGAEIVVTGANSGIGEAAAEQFAALGAHVHMVVRNVERGEAARARITERTGSDTVRLHECDVSSLESVRAFAASLNAELSGTGVMALVHNAGVMTKERERSVDGFELTLATHVLGPLLLTNLLTPLLERSAALPGRLRHLRRHVHREARRRRPRADRARVRRPRFYAHAKRIQVILTSQLDARLEPLGISVHAMHPGWVDTPGVVDSLPRFHSTLERILRTPAQGADTIVWLAAADEPVRPGSGGKLWMDRRIRPAHRVPWTHEDEVDRARMWSRASRDGGHRRAGGVAAGVTSGRPGSSASSPPPDGRRRPRPARSPHLRPYVTRLRVP